MKTRKGIKRSRPECFFSCIDVFDLFYYYFHYLSTRFCLIYINFIVSGRYISLVLGRNKERPLYVTSTRKCVVIFPLLFHLLAKIAKCTTACHLNEIMIMMSFAKLTVNCFPFLLLLLFSLTKSEVIAVLLLTCSKLFLKWRNGSPFCRE